MKKETKFKQTEIGKIPEDWDVRKIGDISKFQYGLGESAKPVGDFIYIRITDIDNNGFLNKNGLVFVGKEKVKENCILKKGDVLVARTGATYGKTYLFKENFHATYGGFLIKFLLDKKYIDNYFFFQFSRSRTYWYQANNLVSGGAQPQFNANTISELMIPLPPIYEQELIAKILSDLDSKIELNHRMNKTLEAIGQAIFKRWFIDFEFPNEEGKPYKSSGGEMVYNEELEEEIPRGWEGGKLSDVVEITSSKRIFLSEYQKEGVPFFRSKEIIELYSGKDISLELYISPARYEEVKKKYGVPRNRDILLTSVGTIGIPYLVKENDYFYFKDGNLTWFRNYQKNMNGQFIYYWLQSKCTKQQIKAITIGSTQQALTINGLNNLNIVIPTENILKSFLNIINKLIDKKEINTQEISLLQQIRDSLLPKLMSGKIRVKVTG